MSMTATSAQAAPWAIDEGIVEVGDESYYAVTDIGHMTPFLTSVVSDGDRWMFVSSTGALTAGRRDPATALFPYETDDRLHLAAGTAGPVTAVRVRGDGDTLWRPFLGSVAGVERRLYKANTGDTLVFEEVHAGLGMTFRYRWANTDRFGFVRTATLANGGAGAVHVAVVDGIVNLLPYGIDPTTNQRRSNLANAYKRSELIDARTGLAVYTLEAEVVDRPEPAEVLRGTVAWSAGLAGPVVGIDPDRMDAFVAGDHGPEEALVTGRPGAYVVSAEIDLDPGASATWHVVADVARDQVAVSQLRKTLRAERDLSGKIEAAIVEARDSLRAITARADAAQRTGDRTATVRHAASVTYNVMRGGVPLREYDVGRDDLVSFVADRNREVVDRHRSWLADLPEVVDRTRLQEQIVSIGDPDLVRLGLEYLPFSFSRRHGDPSRPWNTFSIRVQDDEGNPVVYFAGNWRDIFQNWAALSLSVPRYLPSMVAVFVNASTPDGFNPYRISSRGIDWETFDPDDPWSNIGYWGDHQIVYLLQLLELSDRLLPGEIDRLWGESWFSYADVPYRIAPYEDLLRDPKATIHFDDNAAVKTAERVAAVGGDGKLVWGRNGRPHLVTLVEKLVVPALAKLSNFVPGGGIWMNTQRPEWNDANNALVGFGLSMVTVCQLRRYLAHLGSVARRCALPEVEMSVEVADWLDAVTAALRRADPQPPAERVDRSRKDLLDELGSAFSAYRSRVYAAGFGDRRAVGLGAVTDLVEVALGHLDAAIGASRRPDGLYHSYNVVGFSADGSAASVDHLQEMLEGQVAVLGSGTLSAAEQADVVDALFASALYREDQRSFMLYPIRYPPSFLDKNVVQTEAVTSNPLLSALLAAGDTSVVVVDADGRHRFSADFAGQPDLERALDRLAAEERWNELVATHRDATLETYERVFRHHAFTGRSGTMYAYEGIGSIYWHMVAKLAVAVQDATVEAVADGVEAPTVERLRDAYRRVRSGLGPGKAAHEYGAVPTEPHSHTPLHAGAQQPGMTGLVSEEVQLRLLELGVRVDAGEIVFDPVLLRRRELLERPVQWDVPARGPDVAPLELAAGSLGLTLCQVPVVVEVTPDEPHVEVRLADGTSRRRPGLRVDRDLSAEVFARSGRVTRISALVLDDTIR